jgi:hypothetical protein
MKDLIMNKVNAQGEGQVPAELLELIGRMADCVDEYATLCDSLDVEAESLDGLKEILEPGASAEGASGVTNE